MLKIYTPGLIIIHKLGYSSKVDLFHRFSIDFEYHMEKKFITYDKLLKNLRECGQLRNIVVHADWFSTDIEGYTFVNLKISKTGMEQEYLQFTKESLEKIIDLIIETKGLLSDYLDERSQMLGT